MSSKDDNILLLKGNHLFNNELIQFKSLEFNDQFSDQHHQNGFAKMSEKQQIQQQKYSTATCLDDQLDFHQLNSISSMNQLNDLETKSNAESIFTQDVLLRNFNSIFQNQLIEDRSSQENEKDSSFDEETVDYCVQQHIRQFLKDKASNLFMMNHSTTTDNLITSSTKSTMKKGFNYSSIDLNKLIKNDESNEHKKYSTDSDFNLNESTSKSATDKLFDLSDEMQKNDESELLKSELDKTGVELKKYDESNVTDKYDLKNKSNYLLNNDDDLKAFESSLLERYKKISKTSNDKTTNKLYDSTGELNGNSSPSSLNSSLGMKSSDLSTTIADYNFLNHDTNESSTQPIDDTNHMNEIDYLTLKLNKNSIDNSKQVNEIEQKLNESRTENLNLMLALENNNTTMKKNLEMAKSLKTELETTKTNFDKYKQQTNLVIEQIINKNKNLNQELGKCKQNQLKLEDEKRKELDDLKIKNSFELNEMKMKLKDKEDTLKLTTNDLYQCNKKLKEQNQKLSTTEQKLEDYEKKLSIYIKELTNQKSKLELNKEEIEIRKRRIQTLEENLGDKLNELDSLQQELTELKKMNKQLEEKNDKLLETVKQVDVYADKYKIEYEKRMNKDKELNDLKTVLKRVITERDESFKQLDILKTNWKQFQLQTAEQQLQLQQQLTTAPSLDKYHNYQTGRLNKIYSSPSLNDFYDTSNSTMGTMVPASRQTNKHRLNGQNELFAIEKIQDEDKNQLINALSKQNYLNNLPSLLEQLNCDQCMSNSYSQFNTLQMNSSSTKQHLSDHCTDLMNQIRQQNLTESELAFLKNSKKFKKESQKITKLEKK